jgi:hypothetical protein
MGKAQNYFTIFRCIGSRFGLCLPTYKCLTQLTDLSATFRTTNVSSTHDDMEEVALGYEAGWPEQGRTMR